MQGWQLTSRGLFLLLLNTGQLEEYLQLEGVRQLPFLSSTIATA